MEGRVFSSDETGAGSPNGFELPEPEGGGGREKTQLPAAAGGGEGSMGAKMPHPALLTAGGHESGDRSWVPKMLAGCRREQERAGKQQVSRATGKGGNSQAQPTKSPHSPVFILLNGPSLRFCIPNGPFLEAFCSFSVCGPERERGASSPGAEALQCNPPTHQGAGAWGLQRLWYRPPSSEHCQKKGILVPPSSVSCPLPAQRRVCCSRSACPTAHGRAD